MAFYKAEELSPRDSKQRSVLVVAIRGSAGKVDHMVNLNNQEVQPGDFLVRFAQYDKGIVRS